MSDPSRYLLPERERLELATHLREEPDPYDEPLFKIAGLVFAIAGGIGLAAAIAHFIVPIIVHAVSLGV